MSGPNTDYDPVEVTPLKAEEVERMRDEALAAIAGAADLDELKQVRLDHAGDSVGGALEVAQFVLHYHVVLGGEWGR